MKPGIPPSKLAVSSAPISGREGRRNLACKDFHRVAAQYDLNGSSVQVGLDQNG